MIDMVVVLSFLSFVFEIQVGAFGVCVDSSKGWKIGALLRRLLAFVVEVDCLGV
jgi:hypothetical protein